MLHFGQLEQRSCNGYRDLHTYQTVILQYPCLVESTYVQFYYSSLFLELDHHFARLQLARRVIDADVPNTNAERLSASSG
jgi:hypothetical protein